MLLEIAVADAYGAGFEYGDPAALRTRNTLAAYVKHPRHPLPPGCYTDDTQMSLAIAEAMLSGERWTPGMLAGKFVEAFQRDPREGYAQGFYQFLKQTETAEAFLANILPDSDKSGAAMRATPIGLYPNVGEVIERCTVQARLTHDTPDGIGAAVAAALLAHYCAYDHGPLKHAGAWIEGQIGGQWSAPWAGKVGPKGWMSVRAAITAVSRAKSLSGLLKDCIAFSGDVDTVAAIAAGAASLSEQVVQDLPDGLVLSLEDGRFGRNYVIDLDRQLMERFEMCERPIENWDDYGEHM